MENNRRKGARIDRCVGRLPNGADKPNKLTPSEALMMTARDGQLEQHEATTRTTNYRNSGNDKRREIKER